MQTRPDVRGGYRSKINGESLQQGFVIIGAEPEMRHQAHVDPRISVVVDRDPIRNLTRKRG